ENRLTCVCVDSKQRLWVGTYNDGLNLMDDKGKGFHHFHHTTTAHSLSADKVWLVYEDNLHRIWIGTNYGLSLYDEPISDFKNYYFNDSISATLNGNKVNVILGTHDHRMYTGTDNGLYLLDSSKDRFVPFGLLKELSNIPIYGLQEDAKGSIWITTQK